MPWDVIACVQRSKQSMRFSRSLGFMYQDAMVFLPEFPSHGQCTAVIMVSLYPHTCVNPVLSMFSFSPCTRVLDAFCFQELIIVYLRLYSFDFSKWQINGHSGVLKPCGCGKSYLKTNRLTILDSPYAIQAPQGWRFCCFHHVFS